MNASPEIVARRGFQAWLDAQYVRLLRWAMGHRVLVAGLALLVMASSVPLYRVVQQEYVPSNTDEGEFEINLNAPEGASLKAMNAVSFEVEKELQAVRGVRWVLCSVGGGGFLGSVNNARIYVRLAPHSERTFQWSRLLQWPPWNAMRGNYSQREVIQEIRQRLRKFTDLRLSIRNQQTINLGGPNYDVDFALLGPDLDALARYSEELRKKAPELGLLDADTTLRLNKPELRVNIDRARAARLGVQTEDIADALRIMVGGDQRVSRFRDESISEDYDVQLRLEEVDRQDARSIARLFVPGAQGLIRLDNVVGIEPAKTVSRIDRLDRQRQVRLRTAIAPGYAQADRIAALRAEVDRMNLPSAYSTRVSGKARELETTFSEFIWAFALSLVLMYIILASQFENLVHPLTILLSLPLSVPFALLSLWLTGQTINLYSALGMLVLFGVVKKNAILQIDHMNTLRAQGMERLAAILQANRDRLRPILMTTLTLVAGMIPLAIGSGPGAEERRATAVVVIGGQSLCLLLTLVVTPVAYSLFDDFGRLFRRKAVAVAAAPAATLS